MARRGMEYEEGRVEHIRVRVQDAHTGAGQHLPIRYEQGGATTAERPTSILIEESYAEIAAEKRRSDV